MKVRLVTHLVPLHRGEAPQGSFPFPLPEFIKLMALKPGEPVIMSKIVDVPDDMPVKLHGGLHIAVTPDHTLQVSFIKWDRFDEDAQIKVVFGGGCEVDQLKEIMHGIKEEGGWEEGCGCRECREKKDFSAMMRRLMENTDPESN